MGLKASNRCEACWRTFVGPPGERFCDYVNCRGPEGPSALTKALRASRDIAVIALLVYLLGALQEWW